MLEITKYNIEHKPECMPEIADIDIYSKTDLNNRYERDNVYLFVTKGTLLVVSGEIDGKYEKTSYELSDISDIHIESMIGSINISGKYKGEDCVFAVSTNALKAENGLFVKYIKQLIDKKELEIDEEDFKEERFCPKCHTRYPDSNRKICPKCMDKLSLVKRFSILLAKYKKEVALVLFALLLVSLSGIFAPYISSKFFYDSVLTEGNRYYGKLLLVVGIIIATNVLNLLVLMFSNVITAKMSGRLVYDLKKTIFDSIKRLSMSFFTGRQTGGLMTQINNDANAIYWFFVDGLTYMLISAVQIIVVIVIMIVLDPILALLCLIPTPLFLFTVTKIMKKADYLYAKNYAKARAMNSVLSDSLSGVRVVKAFARENEESKRFNKYSRAAAHMYKKITIFNNTRYPFANVIMYLSTLICWGFGGYMVMTDRITYGTLVTFVAYVGMVNSPMYMLVDLAGFFTECVNALQRLFEIADARPEVVEAEHPVSKEIFDGKVEFKDVCFSYEKNKKVLEGISFTVDAGSMLGIVGHSGAGKSTIANLLIRLYDTESGGIYIDGISICDICFEDLRRNVSIVSQETYLFIGSIYDNIAYACPNVSREEVIDAAISAKAHEFIVKLPDGYDTKIGFGYKDLSGGERQRISIARAILKKPRILILDEATAAMDTATEKHIQLALESLTKGKTTIVIAHRLSTLRNADSLIVIENGKMPEQGTHAELIEKKGIYFNLYKLQLSALKSIGIEE